MKHSDLKIGMKVKRVSMFSNSYYPSTKGNISTVSEILVDTLELKNMKEVLLMQSVLNQ